MAGISAGLGGQINNNIQTDGLVLYLDAAYKKSYPRTETTWYDLSGYGNHGTLTNGVAYDSSGYLSCDGSNDSIDIAKNSTWQINTPSAFVWAHPGSSADWSSDYDDAHKILFSSTHSGGVTIALAHSAYTSHGSADQGSLNTFIYSDSKYTIANYNFDNVPDGWAHIGFTFSTSLVTLYVNGKAVATKAPYGSNAVTWPASSYMHLGAEAGAGSNPDSRWTNIKYANFVYYNRTISAAEVLQNFNAQKERFGY